MYIPNLIKAQWIFLTFKVKRAVVFPFFSLFFSQLFLLSTRHFPTVQHLCRINLNLKRVQNEITRTPNQGAKSGLAVRGLRGYAGDGVKGSGGQGAVGVTSPDVVYGGRRREISIRPNDAKQFRRRSGRAPSPQKQWALRPGVKDWRAEG